MGKIWIASSPKAEPVSAPSMREGEKTPPPMRPAMVIATATALTTAKTTAVKKTNCVVSASEVVS